MTAISNLTGYSADLVKVLSASRKPADTGTASTDTGASVDPAAGFTATPVVLTVNPDTGATVNTTFQVYNGTASLPKISLAPGQLQALQEFQPAAPPQTAPVDLNAAQQVLKKAETNGDGTIGKSTLESLAISEGSNVTQADGLFNALATGDGSGRSIDVTQILDSLAGVLPKS